jgi:hypothetical protein
LPSRFYLPSTFCFSETAIHLSDFHLFQLTSSTLGSLKMRQKINHPNIGQKSNVEYTLTFKFLHAILKFIDENLVRSKSIHILSIQSFHFDDNSFPK